MIWNEQSIARVYRAGARGAPTPDLESLLALGRGQQPSSTTHIEQLARNSQAADRVRLLQELARWSGAARKPAFQVRGWAVAAMLAVLIAGSWLTLQGMPPPAPAVRGVPDSGFSPQDGAQVADAPIRLSWPDIRGARLYRTTVYNSGLAPMWQGPWTAQSGQDLPAPVRDRLEPGQPWFWRVTVDTELDYQLLPLKSFTVQEALQ